MIKSILKNISKKLLTQKGLGLPEVLIAAGLASGLALGIAQMGKNQTNIQVKAEIDNDILNFGTRVNTTLTRPELCQPNFINKPVAATTLTSGSIQIMGATIPIGTTTNWRFADTGISNRVRIEQISYTVSDTSVTPGNRQAFLDINISYGIKTISQMRTVPKSFRANVIVNGSGVILGCPATPGSNRIFGDNSCDLPWGGTIADGANITAYLLSMPPGACASESRHCSNLTLSGSNINKTCTAGCASTPWGPVTSGYSGTAYQSDLPTGSCNSQTRTCTNGSFSGTYTYLSCTPGCTATPWGDVKSGFSSVAYSAATAANCASIAQSRTCTNGTMSGTFTYANCTDTPAPVNCTAPWGSTVINGAQVPAYSTSSSTDCSSVMESRRCNNGTLSGSYSNQSCYQYSPDPVVNGGWTAWEDTPGFGCPSTCGLPAGGSSNRKFQRRFCTNPAPSGGGTNCVGSSNQTLDCPATPACCSCTIRFKSWSNYPCAGAETADPASYTYKNTKSECTWYRDSAGLGCMAYPPPSTFNVMSTYSDNGACN